MWDLNTNGSETATEKSSRVKKLIEIRLASDVLTRVSRTGLTPETDCVKTLIELRKLL